MFTFVKQKEGKGKKSNSKKKLMMMQKIVFLSYENRIYHLMLFCFDAEIEIDSGVDWRKYVFRLSILLQS